MDGIKNVASAEVPIRLVTVRQISTDPASAGEVMAADIVPPGEAKPRGPKVAAALWGDDSGQAYAGVAEPHQFTDGFGSGDADGD